MKEDLQEDMKGSQEIAKQKREQSASEEEMSTWEFGKGIKKKKDGNQHVRSKVQ